MSALQSRERLKENKTSTYGLMGEKFRAIPRGGSRMDEVREICDAIHDILAACFGVSGRDIKSNERSRTQISRIRQIGMYVAHVTVGLTMQEVGTGFQRDRSTVAHACHVVEDLRDEPEFERIIHMLERIAQIAFVRNDRW